MRAGQRAKLRADKRDPRKTRIIKKPYAVDKLKKKKEKIHRKQELQKSAEVATELEQKWQNKEQEIKRKTNSAVDALLQVMEKMKNKKKPSLFEDKDSKLKLNVTCVKLYPNRKLIRWTLPHPTTSPENKPSICLFVSDLKKGFKVDHEPTVDHVKQVLKEQGIKYITEVIPLRQLKVDYKTFEAKRNLSDRHDIFLADNKIIRFLPVFLGKSFYGRKRIPIQVELRGKDWDSNFKKVLKKAHLHMDNSGTCSSVTVANSSQSKEEITSNIVTSVKHLYKDYPGGWRNIRNIYLKSDQTDLSIPIHVSFIDTNQVKRDMPKREKDKPVIGETGITLNKVAVYPEGKVKVRHGKKAKVEVRHEEDLSDDESESGDSDSDMSHESESDDDSQTPMYEDEEDMSPVIEQMDRNFEEESVAKDEVSSENESEEEPQPQKRTKKKGKRKKGKKTGGFSVSDKVR